ncbi:CoA-acylating propionaldehyde dehydrogenase [Vibrio maritimus]|uniref:CoA-acylating propionaldehyde dehydrogenase n=1 Tax=Vibrio maritimus TaxID=990268 RepID=A0A090TA38_9VIBR|nr:CoA-acylating propionaldehyde dehydrogenase [Vibrio maritimus]
MDEIDGAKPCTAQEIARLWHPVKQHVGQDAGEILKSIGVESETRLAVMVVENDHPLVHVEQMMPVLPVVRCANIDEAIERAVAAERGNKHSACIYLVTSRTSLSSAVLSTQLSLLTTVQHYLVSVTTLKVLQRSQSQVQLVKVSQTRTRSLVHVVSQSRRVVCVLFDWLDN